MADYIEVMVSDFTSYAGAVQLVRENSIVIALYGPIPPLPVYAVVDADVTDALAARATWLANITPYRENAAGLVADAEFALGAMIADGLVPNQWTALSAVTPGDFQPYADNVWVGFVDNGFINNQNSIPPPRLVIAQVEPLAPFKNFNPAQQPRRNMPFLLPPIGVTVTVDNPFTVPFSFLDLEGAYGGEITVINVNGSAISSGAWTLNVNEAETGYESITFDPSMDSGLQTDGVLLISIVATGYPTNTFTQPLLPGAPVYTAIQTQPTAPATNGGELGTQPVVVIYDQYGNQTLSTDIVTASADPSVTWTIGGMVAVAAVKGVVTFDNLTAAHTGGQTGCAIDFTPTIASVCTSDTFDIPA